MTDTVESSDTDERQAALSQLLQALTGHGFTAELDGDELKVSAEWAPRKIVVSCRPRASCGGELWFMASGEPIAPAEPAQIMNAVTGIKGLTADTRTASQLLDDPAYDPMREPVPGAPRLKEILASEAGGFYGRTDGRP